MKRLQQSNEGKDNKVCNSINIDTETENNLLFNWQKGVEKPRLDIIGSFVAKIEQQTPAQKVANLLEMRRKIYELRSEIGKKISRVFPCGHHPVGHVDHIDAARGVTHKNSYFTNLQSCKSVWVCPVCSLKISTQRAHDVRDICTNIFSKGYKAFFLTLTVKHSQFSNLANLQEGIANAYRKMTRHRNYKELVFEGFGIPVRKDDKQKKEELYKRELELKQKKGKNWQYIDFELAEGETIAPAYIRSLELTKDSLKLRGWHPHLHIIFFYRGEWDTNGMKLANKLRRLWLVALASEGLSGLLKFQVAKPVFNGDDLSDYITKWDLSKELTEGHTKKTSRTPFTIFKEYLTTGEEKYLNDFKEFAIAFKSKKQLTFSDGLKKQYMSRPEKSDAEICKDDEIASILFSVDLDLWKEIRRYGVQSDLLTAFDAEGFEGVCNVLDNYLQYEVRTLEQVVGEKEKRSIQVPFFGLSK